MLISLIGIDRKVKPQPRGHCTNRRIFRPMDVERDALGKVGHRNPSRVRGEKIFGQHCQPHRQPGVLFDEDHCAADLAFDCGDMGQNLRAHGGRICAALGRAGGKLHGDGGIGFDHSPKTPGFISPCGSSSAFSAFSNRQARGSLRCSSG